MDFLLSLVGTLVNSGAIIVGALVGLLLYRLFASKKSNPSDAPAVNERAVDRVFSRVSDGVRTALALFVVYLGVTGFGAVEVKDMRIFVLAVLISLMLGGIIGSAIDLDGLLVRLGERLSPPKKTANGADSGSENSPTNNFSAGFVAATLLFCTGGMAIMGALDGGLRDDHSLLYVKALLDGVSALILASQFGAGVALSAACVLIYQGTIAEIACLVGPYLSAPIQGAMSYVGSILIIGLALNMLGITAKLKLKMMNLVPSIFVAAAIAAAFEALGWV